jgi:hypothetical protein
LSLDIIARDFVPIDISNGIVDEYYGKMVHKYYSTGIKKLKIYIVVRPNKSTIIAIIMDNNVNMIESNYWTMLNKDLLEKILDLCEVGIDVLMSFVSRSIRIQIALHFSPNLKLIDIIECGTLYGNPNIIRLGSTGMLLMTLCVMRILQNGVIRICLR